MESTNDKVRETVWTAATSTCLEPQESADPRLCALPLRAQWSPTGRAARISSRMISSLALTSARTAR